MESINTINFLAYLGGVSQNFSSVTNDNFSYKLLKSFL